MRRIFISGTNGLPASYGGWDPLLNQLSKYLSKCGYEVIVHTEKKRKFSKGYKPKNVKIQFIPLNANGKTSIFYDLLCLCDAYIKGGIVIMLGTSGGIFIPFFRLLGLKIVTNLAGEEWKRNKWRVFGKTFLLISDFAARIGSNVVVADHPEIFKRAKKIAWQAVYIPYGSNHKPTNFNLLKKESIKEVLLKYKVKQNNYFFKVCRIEPENNIHLILEAFSELPYNLLIIGNWNNSPYGIRLREKYDELPNIFFENAMYNKKELDILRKNSSGYLHGHTVGGTNPSLIESMALGCLILAHGNKYNKYVTNEKCFYFNDIKSIKKQVKNMMKLTKSERQKICDESKNRAIEYYAWDKVLADYKKVIDKLNKFTS